jgi:hypothetical protein
VRNTYVSNAWGDGVFISGYPADVSVENVIADSNRRQGLTINDALRPRVLGGIYQNSGSIKYTAPGAGIDIEPDEGTTRQVVDAVLRGVLFSGNKGVGFWSSSNGRPLSCTLDRCRAVGTVDGDGFIVSGSNNSTVFNACESTNNGMNGFNVEQTVTTSTRFTGCIANSNTQEGFLIAGDNATLDGCHAQDNGRGAAF